MSELLTRLEETSSTLRSVFGDAPTFAVVCGSGYQFLEGALTEVKSLGFGEIPNFGTPSNPAHKGRLLVGLLGGVRVAILLGRFHGYEGVAPSEVVFPVRALARWGVSSFALTNAAGGIREGMRVGELMVISDHINLLGWNPLTGPNEGVLGTRFPDMTKPWDPDLRRQALEFAYERDLHVHEGVYVAVPGPSYETPAEIRMFRGMGADAVGMSTVPECIALRHMGKRVFGLSTVTNAAAGLSHELLSDDDVVSVMFRPAVQREITQLITHVATCSGRVT